MANKIRIEGTSGNIAEVTSQGALKIIPNEFSDVSKQSITDANAVTFFPPRAGFKFIVTGTIINTNRNVGVNGAVIDLYEATSADSTTISKSIIQLDQVKNITSALLPLFAEITEGVWVNGKADDFDVNISVFGYYVKA